MTIRALRLIAAALCAGVLVAPAAPAQDEAVGVVPVDPADIVAARQGLKAQIALMRTDIEIAVEEGDDASFEQRADDLATIAAILDAFPYLFPPETSPAALAEAGLGVTTDASPAIWESPVAFRDMAKSVAGMARAASDAADFAALAQASAGLWQSCTACHDAYLEYDPLAGMEGMELDFDSPFF